ncbi:MAG: 2-oxo acid dehydrogenase subunit E2 [Leptonema sp. (in: Bacteria)]|nr:2-oxo acid dehydrogenase subunit E2 [Leptonema sp. (in: bacteria)]
MARILELMQLSPTMKLGTFVRWLKKPGDAVEPDDTVAEIETDKAVMEMSAFDTGVILGTLVEEGEHLPVGAPIAIIGEVGEDISGLLTEAKSKLQAMRNEAGQEIGPTTADSSSTSAPIQSSEMKIEPVPQDQIKTQKIIESPKISPPSLIEDPITGALPVNRPTEKLTVPISTIDRPIIDEPALNGLISLPPHITLARSMYRTKYPISPLARKLAEAHGIDISILHPSDSKRIKAADVEQFIKNRSGRAPATKPVAADRKVALSGMRRVIAQRLSDSKTHIPHYYLTADFDASAMVRLREEINAGLSEHDQKFSVNDFIVRGCALSLKKHPVVNSSWRGDHIVRYGRVDIGIAVALDEGLITPYVRNADQLPMHDLAVQIRKLAKRAKDRKLRPDEYSDGTFTVSNLGMYGIREFSAIINEPEAAIMAVGGIFEKPVVKAGEVIVSKSITVTLSCDHRVVDGAEGASFLATFKHYMEHPALLLV